MTDAAEGLKTEFVYGTSTVRILEGNILDRVREKPVDVLVSPEDNYMTMQGRGVSGQLREQAGAKSAYAQAAQEKSPVKAGEVIDNALGQELANALHIGYVFHAAVADYDSDELTPEETVTVATLNCLKCAGELGLRSILFPALGTGEAGLSMRDAARSMCGAIKAYLAEERPVKEISIVLYDKGDTPDQIQRRKDENHNFIREANLALNVPYDPQLRSRQVRDFYGRTEIMKRLEALLNDPGPGKRHVAILGGPRTGKSALLDQLYSRARQPDSPLAGGRQVTSLTFGRVLNNTPVSFVHRKLLLAMIEQEQDSEILRALKETYADPDITCDDFVRFLDEHAEHYPGLVFLVDGLPLMLSDDGSDAAGKPFAFWDNLQCLTPRARFFFTVQDIDQFDQLMEWLETSWPEVRQQVARVEAKCVSEEDRTAWVADIYRHYVDQQGTVPQDIQDFVRDEAGRHPFLVSLACHALIERIQGVDKSFYLGTETQRKALPGILQKTQDDLQEPRRAFFAELMQNLPREYEVDLRSLAQAVIQEEQREALLRAASDPDARAELVEILEQEDPREFLHPDVLDALEDRAYLVKDSKTAPFKGWDFMSRGLADYVLETLGSPQRQEDRPTDVTISVLQKDARLIRTLFDSRRAQVIAAEKPLTDAVKKEFMGNFGEFLERRRASRGAAGAGDDDSSGFHDAEEVGSFILTQFTTTAIQRYLDHPVHGCTISFLVDEAYKEIPWELMLEAVYAGEIPFRVGRSIISEQPPLNIHPPTRGRRQVKALLIGDPCGDLAAAVDEVEYVEGILKKDTRFAPSDVLIGPKECKKIRVLNALSSGQFGLVHYSGHSIFADQLSAWQLADGNLTTQMLTSAVQTRPPALVISSSCSSAAAGEALPPRYENQAFDLPGAFLQAGVEAYVGALWEVDATAARRFVELFYNAFLSSQHNLGECLRRARWALKQDEEGEGLVNWLAFILYGDPRVVPADLFPALRVATHRNSS